MNDFSFSRSEFTLTFGGDGSAQVHGVAHRRGAGANAILIADSSPAQATCADTDGDGDSGITSLQFDTRDPRSERLVPVSVVPVDGDIDDQTRHFVVIVIGTTTVLGWASFYGNF